MKRTTLISIKIKKKLNSPKFEETRYFDLGSTGTQSAMLLGTGGGVPDHHSYLVPPYPIPGFLYYLVPGIVVQFMTGTTR